MSEIAFLEPDNVDSALLNWSTWARRMGLLDASADSRMNIESMRHAVEVERIFMTLSPQERRAIKLEYTGQCSNVERGVLYTAKQAVEQGLKDRKLLQ